MLKLLLHLLVLALVADKSCGERAAEVRYLPYEGPVYRSMNSKIDKSDPVPRIINGFYVVEPVPWIVWLYESGGFGGCTGSLINSEYILTAAHCMWKRRRFYELFCREPLLKRPTSNKVAIGEKNRKYASQIHQVNNYWVHPQFNGLCNNYEMDIAVLKLARPVSNDPLCLGSYSNAGQLYAIGYGRTDHDIFSVTNQLKAAKVQNIPLAQCSDIWEETISSNKLCTLGKDDEVNGPCQGDSGGPLTIYSESGGHIQIGVMSYVGANETNCDESFPDVYVRVSAALPFIRSKAGSIKTC